MTFPALRDGRVVKEAFASGLPKPSFNLRLQHAAADLRRYPRARGDRRCCSISNGSTAISSSVSIGAAASFFDGSELSAHQPPGRCARTRPARAVPRRGARRRARRHLGAAGHRRLRPRSRHLAARARRCLTRGGLRTARHRTRRTRSRQAVHLRDHGHDQAATRSGSRCCSPRNLKRAGINARRSALSMRCSTRRRRIAFDFDMIQNRWDQSLSPGNEQAFYWSSAAADEQRQPQLHGRASSPAIDAHDRRAAQGRRAATISSPRCVRSTAC